VSEQQLAQRIACDYGIPLEEQHLRTLGGRRIPSEGVVHGATVQVCLALVGGKGGFGSMLRSQGGKMAAKASVNFEACRDLSGQRLRVVTQAKEIAKYQERMQEDELIRKAQRKRKMELGLRLAAGDEVKKHFFSDPNFKEATEELVSSTESAVAAGMEAEKQLKEEEAKKQQQRAQAEKAASSRLSLWDDPDLAGLSSDDDDDDDDETVTASSSSSSSSSSK